MQSIPPIVPAMAKLAPLEKFENLYRGCAGWEMVQKAGKPPKGALLPLRHPVQEQNKFIKCGRSSSIVPCRGISPPLYQPPLILHCITAGFDVTHTNSFTSLCQLWVRNFSRDSVCVRGLFPVSFRGYFARSDRLRKEIFKSIIT